MREDKEFTKILVRQIHAAKDMMDWGRAGGLIAEQQFRLTIEARKEKAKELIDAGMSRRQAANALGVGHSTINRDLDQNCPKSGPKRSTDEEETSDADNEEGLRVIAARGLLNRAAEAKELATIGKLEASEVTEAMIVAAEVAAAAWNRAAHQLRGMKHK